MRWIGPVCHAVLWRLITVLAWPVLWLGDHLFDWAEWHRKRAEER